jgi:hypothetical protein
MVFNGTGLIDLVIPASVKILGEECFAECKFLSSVRFEPGSRLSRIERGVFRDSGLKDIVIPASIEFMGQSCFAGCKSLLFVIFESGSRLSQTEKKMALIQSGLSEMIVQNLHEET